MNRRTFLKGTSAAIGSSMILPNYLFGNSTSNLDGVKFNQTLFDNYDSQSIVIFLYGGASELAGNMSNFEDIKKRSQNSYPNIEVTENGFWKEAGGDLMEKMIANKNMSIVRTINRVKNNTRSHGLQQIENMKGSTDTDKAGFFRDILEVLHKNGKVTENSLIPSMTLSESAIYENGNLIANSILNPTTVSDRLENPFDFENTGHLADSIKDRFYKLLDSRNATNYENEFKNKIKEHYAKRKELSTFIEEVSKKTLPVEFPSTSIGRSVESTLKLMLNNKETKLGFINFPGGWDDHSNSIWQYQDRHNQLIEALDKAVETLKASNNKSINIWVMTEFGRNVNLNNSGGWDHGNQFNLMLFSNSDKLQMGKIIGETEVYGENGNRLYTRPKEGSVSFEPYAIASTIYKLFGIENPELITGYKEIEPLI